MFTGQLRHNLISGSQLDLCGLTFCGGQSAVDVRRGDDVLFKAFLKDRIYKFFPKKFLNPVTTMSDLKYCLQD